MTGKFDAVVGLNEIAQPLAKEIAPMVAEELWLRGMISTCRTCDNRPPPPHDDDAEDRVLAAILGAEAGQAFPGFDPSHFYSVQMQRCAFILGRGLAAGAPLSPEEAFRALCASYPQLARVWAEIIARLDLEAPASSDERVAEDIARLRLLADVRTLLSTLGELDADARDGRLAPEDIYKRGAVAFAPFRPKATR